MLTPLLLLFFGLKLLWTRPLLSLTLVVAVVDDEALEAESEPGSWLLLWRLLLLLLLRAP